MNTFNINDEVTIDVDKADELSWQLRNMIRDRIGVIKDIEHHTLFSSVNPYSVFVIAFDKIYVRLSDVRVLQLAHNPPLTIAEIQQLKEKLTLDLLALIEAYEKITDTHIANIHLMTSSFEGDGRIVKRVIGVRLEVQL